MSGPVRPWTACSGDPCTCSQQSSRPLELVVPVLVADLMRAATGNPITVSTLDGQDVVLRLCTPDEALQFERDARTKLAAMGLPVSAQGMSRSRAEEICAPLDLTHGSDGDR